MKFERVSTESAIGFKFKYLMMFIHTWRAKMCLILISRT
jgi:hypothetical protein